MFSRGGSLLPSSYADARAVLMSSLFQRPKFKVDDRVKKGKARCVRASVRGLRPTFNTHTHTHTHTHTIVYLQPACSLFLPYLAQDPHTYSARMVEKYAL